MFNFLKFHLPIRAKLTLWYVLLLAITFGLLGFYLIFRFQNSLMTTVDNSLKFTVVKTIAALDEQDFRETNKLTFDIAEKAQIQTSGFAMRILSPQGEVWDIFGEIQNVSDWGPTEMGFTTQKGIIDEDEEWRVFSQPVLDSKDQTIAWVQAAQSVASISETLQDLQEQILFGIPLILILAGVGGYFLADRALRPIQQITDTAQAITAQDLSRRLAYEGYKDEIGSLAETFDQMIGRLQSSFERERRFTSDAAHELRTPLTILKGQIDVTLSRKRNSAEYERKLQELSMQVNRLIRLSNALLFLSRSDQNQVSFERTRINLKDLLEVLIEQVRPLADEKKIQVKAVFQDELPVYGDNDHLIRLFMNLLENALKYTPSGGQVTVTGRIESDTAAIAINNTGANISPGYLPHLFERFYRVEDDRSSQTGGSGLGLAIAQEIARLHGGKIDAQSNPNDGVTFFVELLSAK